MKFSVLHIYKNFNLVLNLKFQNAKKYNFYEDCHREYLEKVCLEKSHNCGSSGILKFSLQLHGKKLEISSIATFP